MALEFYIWSLGRGSAKNLNVSTFLAISRMSTESFNFTRLLLQNSIRLFLEHLFPGFSWTSRIIKMYYWRILRHNL